MNESTKEPAAQAAVRSSSASMAGTRVTAGLLAPTCLAWSWLAFTQFQQGLAALAVWNLFTLVLTIATLVAVVRRISYAYAPATWSCWYFALWAAFWAYRGTTLLWGAAACAALAAMALAGSSKAFQDVTVDASKSKGDSPDAWVRDNAESIVVAFIMALIIRCFCIEVFMIPSSSMEPTLLGNVSEKHSLGSCAFREEHGDNYGGDRIMVTKYYYALNPVERFDVVVFKFPLNQIKNFIKRVVGLPDEELFVEHGNIWTRPVGDPQGKFKLARKPLRVQQSLWIPVRDLTPGPKGTPFDEAWEVESGGQAGHRVDGTRVETLEKDGIKDIRFRASRKAEDDCGELSLEFDLELRGKSGTFFVDIPNEFGRFKLILSPDQAGQIEWFGPQKTLRVPLRTARLRPERTYHVQFMVYDGMALALIDNQAEAELPFLESHDDLGSAQEADRITIGASGLLFAMSDLHVGRDVHHEDKRDALRSIGGRDNAVRIPADHFMMMGDNVGQSHDSRAWREHVYELTEEAAKRYGKKEFRCESLEVKDITPEASERWAKKYGLTDVPDHYIGSDDIGYERAFFTADIRLRHPPKEFHFVHRKFLVGKALWTWFPPGRWFRLIR